ncbi:MAG: aminopeptidase P family protein [Clostridiales bacterium]|nr:aminopeptidase P family protein [Clostridiales bacterium]
MTVDWLSGAKRDLDGIELVPCGNIVEKIRATKSQYEISCIQTAQRTAELALQHVLGIIRPGITEFDVAAEIGYFMAKCGCLNSFNTIAASGPNSSMPHAVVSNRVLQKGDFITMDFGCVYDGYISDMTRTVAIGQPTDEMVKVYNIVLEAQKRALDLIAPGVNCLDVDTAARGYIAEMGYGDYFGHGLGHSFGLEVHEEPRFSPQCREDLVPGICISVEPGIYLPGKFGVRIEDTVCVTEDGYMNFTKAPKELIIL